MQNVSGGVPPVTSTPFTRENYLKYLDMVAPNIDRNLHERYPDETLKLTALFKEIGRYKPTTNRKFEHFELDRQYQLVTSAGTVAQPAVGANIVVTIAAADHGVSGNTSLPRVGEIVMFANRVIGTIIAKDTTAPNAHTITVAPNKVADQFPALAADDKIMILTSAVREGSDVGDEQLSRNPSRWAGYTQTIREDYKLTRDSVVTTGWLNVPEKSELARRIGGSGYKWFIKEEKSAHDNIQKKIEFALLHGDLTDNPAILTAVGAGTGDLDLSYTTTCGLLPAIGNHGMNPTYATPGTLALVDFQNLSDLLDENEGASEYLVFAGNKMLHQKDDLITDTFKQGAVTYGAFGNSEERAVRYGFDSFMLGGRTWHFKKYAPFYHPGLFGKLGGGFENDWFGIPFDMRRDARSGEMLPSVCVRYRANGGNGAHGLTEEAQTLSTEMDSSIEGGFPLPTALRTNNSDTATISYLSDIGLQVIGLNRFFHYKNP